jgi:hypothetical protein
VLERKAATLGLRSRVLGVKVEREIAGELRGIVCGM